MVGLFRFTERMPDVRVETAVYNSAPAVVVYSGDQLEGVFLVEIVDGKITQLVCHAQSGQADRDHDPADDQPVALCHAWSGADRAARRFGQRP